MNQALCVCITTPTQSMFWVLFASLSLGWATSTTTESESEFICLVDISRKKIHEVKQISPLPKSKREQKISQCDKES